MLMPRSSSGEGNGTPLQYFCLENPWTEEPGGLQFMGSLRVRHDWATSLSLFTHALGKEMATHSSVLAWRIPGTGEPGGLPSVGSHTVGHDWSDWAAEAPPPFSSAPTPIWLLKLGSCLLLQGALSESPDNFSCPADLFFFNWMKDSLNSIVCCWSVAKAYIY